MTKFLHQKGLPSYLIPSIVSYKRYVNFQENSRKNRRESMLFLEHSPCLTGGIGAKAENLLVSPAILTSLGVELVTLQRGGDFTAHEPGQIVGYLHIDLKKRNLSLGDFLRALNQSLVVSIQKTWGFTVEENPKAPGLYTVEEPKRKLVSEGIYAKSYFTSFGFALNGVNNLSTFSLINPCGARSEDMTSLLRLGKDMDFPKKRREFVEIFTGTFIDLLP
ncbi:lipoyl(octanoyl) transferase LipB [Leptospira sp. 2 VSF19]|uniref:Octanoyltransferase n=1 Tax=Leptospira soteropolitanensis TaxID=2950025 RepID=A0AAW5VMH6_9LEPT|nr:lipoyl(octanoyl) transferase LipB [Leptospira soteropolitanensis]MCW7493777.1 lipoyl(octanoyl) transferase LipB [Leptospira soteropolitanensis]MCW7501375.1 lipoyl(octanoyl) transferase LipB [Leptospira soteropolitanensis]MCW7523439.1 lipoyl(octanoyl) transferase LipB [Leptospira soteropolitanensis]MCW7527489.1 lipoyl(octanoyl) transferase LipB [Leptospira soteropolitanensis]MCW7531345.1 lipoyl(octanoyl) transferase LipB [Leptospira soteropolitanensis]